MLKLLLILPFFAGLPLLASGQQVLPELTRQLGDVPPDEVESKVEMLSKRYQKDHPSEKKQLRLWKFYIADSLGLTGSADSLAGLILKEGPDPRFCASARVYVRSGMQFARLNQFNRAIQLYHSGLKIVEKLGYKNGVAQIKREIGTTYLKLDQHETAESYLRDALDIYSRLKDSVGMANSAMSLGNALKEQKKYEQAKKRYTESMELAKALGNQKLIAGNLNNLGNVYRRQGDLRKALEFFNEALELNKETQNRQWQSFNYNNIGNVYNDLHQYEKALQYFQTSNRIKIELGDSLALLASYEGMSDAYAGLGDYFNAYTYLRRFKLITDSLNLSDQADKLRDLEETYKVEKRELEIERLKANERLKDQINENLEMEAANTWKVALLAIFAVLILLVGVIGLLRSNKLKRRNNDLLTAKNHQIEESNNALQSALKQLSQKNTEIIDSINYATYIQRASLPDIDQQSGGYLNFELFFAPKDIVSGDFYFAHRLPGQSIFGVADCTGHGVPGAMVSLVAMNQLDKVTREEKNQNAAEMLKSLNEHVNRSLYRGSDRINDGMDISLCLLDQRKGLLHFSGANHDGYILRRRTAYLETVLSEDIVPKAENETAVLLSLRGVRRPVGRTYSSAEFFNVSVPLKKGDRVILVSDGYADQMGGPEGKKLKKPGFFAALLESSEMSATEQMQYLRDTFSTWKGEHEQVDDVCLLIAEFQG